MQIQYKVVSCSQVVPQEGSTNRDEPIIPYVKGDLFRPFAQVLANTVNAATSWERASLQKPIKLFPDMYRQYRDLGESG